ncbi:MAG: UMP kinase [Bacteroidales bacterium]|nr:UMP kinase [Bacteroidales bacterium]
MIKYKRILLKLSGEALMGDDDYGINLNKLEEYVYQIKEIADLGVEIGIVIGGGNIFRGMTGEKSGTDRVKGDQMGMLATVINGLAIQSTLENTGQKTIVFTSINIESVGERFNKEKVMAAFKSKKVVIFAGGTGNPYFTTDTASALRALEVEAEILLKGTRVDGIYTADPEKDPAAKKFDEITYEEAIRSNLKIMDITAFTMCRENDLPILVFDMNTKGNLRRVIEGIKTGTIVHK